MRMSCGRSDGEPTNQGRQNPRKCAALRLPPAEAIYYNRLEYSRLFQVFYAAARSCTCLPLETARPHCHALPGVPSRFSVSRAFLSLVQVRKSCHKQLWGLTPFRRGIA
jgi:hypothetical protein